MKLNLYSIFDTASGLYLRPMFAQSDGEAIRAFSDAVTSDTEYGKHPEDYSIHRLGIYDDTNGTLTDEHNCCLGTGLELVAKSQQILKDDDNIFSLSPGGTA